jgi:hypothetical protein
MLLLRLDREVFFVATRRMDTPTPSGSSLESISKRDTCPADGPMPNDSMAGASSFAVPEAKGARPPASEKERLSNARLMNSPSSLWLCADMGW